MARTTIAIAAALALAVTLPAVSAQAQAPRTFVSAAGSDSNPCSFAAPCRHFQAAVNATSAGGEVDALDPAGYGPIIISKAITIEGQGWSYIAPPTDGDGISIAIPGGTGTVAIRGIAINGVGITGARSGIVFSSGSVLNVRDCVIRNFQSSGIDFDVTGESNPSQIFVSNTLISDNGGDGVAIFGSNGTTTGATNGALEHVQMMNNTGSGLSVTPGQTMKVTVNDSISAGNSVAGILANSQSGKSVSIMVRNSTIFNNADGLETVNANATIRITRSTITGNVTGWTGTVLSYGDNNIDDNTNVNTEPPNPLIYK